MSYRKTLGIKGTTTTARLKSQEKIDMQKALLENARLHKAQTTLQDVPSEEQATQRSSHESRAEPRRAEQKISDPSAHIPSLEEKEYENITDGDDLISWLKKHAENKEAMKACIQKHGISIVDRILKEDDVKLISTALSNCSPIPLLGIVSCRPSEEIRQLLRSICGCRIGTFKIEGIEKLGEMSEEICSMAKRCSFRRLHLKATDLTSEDIKKFKPAFLESQIKNLEEFEISHNDTVGKDGFETLGEILKQGDKFCRRLSVVGCGIGDEHLELLQKSLQDAKFDDLCINCNPDLTSSGFRALGEIMSSCGVISVELSDCNITKKKLSSLAETSPAKITKLDVSYNAFLDTKGMRELAKTIQKIKVDRLSLTGCKLDKDKLSAFAGGLKTSKSIFLQELNVSDNFCIGGGLEEVAKIIGLTKLSSLELKNCMLMTEHLKDFANYFISSGLQLAKLDLSDRRRCADERYINVIFEMLPHVTDTLTLEMKKIYTYKARLQQYLDEQDSSVLKIIISPNDELSKSEV